VLRPAGSRPATDVVFAEKLALRGLTFYFAKSLVKYHLSYHRRNLGGGGKEGPGPPPHCCGARNILFGGGI
jgi:hypothetical protein